MSFFLRKYETCFDMGDKYHPEDRYIMVEMPKNFNVIVTGYDLLMEIIDDGNEHFSWDILRKMLVPILKKFDLRFCLRVIFDVIHSYLDDINSDELGDEYKDLDLPELKEIIALVEKTHEKYHDWDEKRSGRLDRSMRLLHGSKGSSKNCIFSIIGGRRKRPTQIEFFGTFHNQFI